MTRSHKPWFGKNPTFKTPGWWLYILYSPSRDHYYVGSTKNLERRIKEHNGGRTKSTRYTKDWVYVYKRYFPLIFFIEINKLEVSVAEKFTVLCDSLDIPAIDAYLDNPKPNKRKMKQYLDTVRERKRTTKTAHLQNRG